MLAVIFILIFGAIGCIVYFFFSGSAGPAGKTGQNEAATQPGQAEKKPEKPRLNLDKKPAFGFRIKGNKKSSLAAVFIPVIITGITGFVVFQNITGIVIGGLAGFCLPSLLANVKEKTRKKKFHGQLVDALMILSSSLKAGLSFLQSLDVLVEEMPSPISEEFGTIIKENKMGIRIEESFEHLNKRMPSEDLNLITTAILIARDTGGDLTVIFENLARTIREKNKIAEQIKTLTTQGRWQGIIMSLLPVGFGIFIFKANPDYMKIMISSQLGRALLIYAVISELIGIFLIKKLTKVEV